MTELLNGIVNILQNGSVEAKIGVISGLLAIAGAIGWVAKVTVGWLIFSAKPAPVAPGGVVITEELLDQIIQKRVREALARDAGPGGESSANTAGLIRDAEAGLEDVAREGADGAAAVERFIETGETGRAKAMLRELAEQQAAEGAKVNAKAAERYRRLGALAFLDSTQEAMAAYARATELDPEDPEGWNMLGALQLRTGALDAAKGSFERVLALGNRLADKSIQARATVFLGWINFTKGNMTTAEQLSEQAVELAKAASDQKQEMQALGNLAVIYRTRGELDRAEAMFLKGLEIDEALGRKEGMAAKTGNLGSLYQQQGDTARACQHWARARDLFREIGSPTAEQVAKALRDFGCPDA
jgi:tetratricopeptide (TPR) repeat protein